MKPASRFDDIEISLIRQINALATPLSINLGIGEPNVEPDAEFREMARRAATEGSWHYTPNAGSLSLRNVIGEMTGADPKSEVCVTAGTQQGLFAIMLAFIESGDEVLVPDPGFLAYPTLVKLVGGSPVSYALDPDGWSIDFENLEKQLSSRTKMIVINSPSNPTGGVLGADDLDRLTVIASERKLLVVSDEVYRSIYYDSEPPTMLGRSPLAIVVSGMSKSHAMTGLRLGWITATRELMEPVIKAHQYVATCASSFSQTLAELVMTSTDWNDCWLEKMREQFGHQRRAALSAIESELHVTIPPPAGAFYAFVPVPSCDTVSLAKSLATEASVLAIPGVAFGARGEGFLRLSYAAPVSAIQKGVGRIGAYLREQGR